MSKIVEFIDETKREIAKVTWPTQRETMMTTVIIVVMALIAGVFFFMVDSAIGFTVSRVLGMKG